MLNQGFLFDLVPVNTISVPFFNIFRELITSILFLKGEVVGKLKNVLKNIFFFLFTSITFCQTEDKLPNIILMIGDGMGLSHISAGMYANNNSTILEEFEYVGLSKTHSLNYLVTDSAASGTAMASGFKTFSFVSTYASATDSALVI